MEILVPYLMLLVSAFGAYCFTKYSVIESLFIGIVTTILVISGSYDKIYILGASPRLLGQFESMFGQDTDIASDKLYDISYVSPSAIISPVFTDMH